LCFRSEEGAIVRALLRGKNVRAPLIAVIHICGATIFAAHCALALLSLPQSIALWDGEDAPKAQALGEQIDRTLTATPVLHVAWDAARDAIEDGGDALLSVSAGLGIASAAFLLLTLAVLRSRAGEVGNREAALIARWAAAFVAASLFAYPVFTQDLWLSAVWGGMIADGMNPYHQVFGDAQIGALPLDHAPMAMTYGPLWALISAAVMTVSAGQAALAFLLFKLILAASWLLGLRLVLDLARDASPRRRALAALVYGWTPLGVHQTVAEGHNDIAMAVCALLWLRLALGRSALSPLALCASALVKYTTLPLYAAGAVFAWAGRRSWRDLIGPLALPPIFIALGIALFFRSFAFFDGLREMSAWRALRPVDALAALEGFTGLPFHIFNAAVLALFPALALVALYRLKQNPAPDSLMAAALALMAAVVFTVSNHPWPWFLVWLLPLAALQPFSWLSRFVTGAALAAPFTLPFWWSPHLQEHKQYAALLLYATALAFAALSRPREKARTEAFVLDREPSSAPAPAE
jgi:alpha-1,6-mannosyltransferase